MSSTPALHEKGFTLVELIAVMVVVSIMAVIGSHSLVKTLEMYRSTSEKSALISRGRVSIEQVTRYLRSAVPNSIRTSTSGRCIEFFQAISGGNYLNELPDTNNGAPAISSLTTGAFYIQSGSPRYFIVAPLLANDIYTPAATSTIVGINSLSGTPYSSINFSLSKIFTRNSVSKRFFLADAPIRFCISNNELIRHTNYGFSTAALTDAHPGGAIDIMTDSVETSASGFSISPSSETNNTSVNFVLSLIKGKSSITLTHKILVRNVP